MRSFCSHLIALQVGGQEILAEWKEERGRPGDWREIYRARLEGPHCGLIPQILLKSDRKDDRNEIVQGCLLQPGPMVLLR